MRGNISIRDDFGGESVKLDITKRGGQYGGGDDYSSISENNIDILDNPDEVQEESYREDQSVSNSSSSDNDQNKTPKLEGKSKS